MSALRQLELFADHAAPAKSASTAYKKPGAKVASARRTKPGTAALELPPPRYVETAEGAELLALFADPSSVADAPTKTPTGYFADGWPLGHLIDSECSFGSHFSVFRRLWFQGFRPTHRQVVAALRWAGPWAPRLLACWADLVPALSALAGPVWAEAPDPMRHLHFSCWLHLFNRAGEKPPQQLKDEAERWERALLTT